MKLAHLLRRPLITLNVTDHCRKAAELMAEFHIRHLPILDEGTPAGMVSERDLLRAIGWWCHNDQHTGADITDWAERLPVSEVMSTPLMCLSPTSLVRTAARLMIEEKISAVALVENRQLTGIVTESDFLHACVGAAAWQAQKVVEHMTANVFHVSPDERIRVAWHRMREKQIRHLVVTKNEQVQGILSDRDLLAGITWNATGSEGIQDTVKHLMSTRVATIAPEASLAEAAQRMLDHKIGALPVMDITCLTGIITETDLLKLWAREPDDPMEMPAGWASAAATAN